MSEVVITPEARLSYPNLVTPRAQKREDGTLGDLKYSTALLFAENGPGIVLYAPDLTELKKAVTACAIEFFGEAKFRLLLEAGKFRSPFRKDAKLKGYPEETTTYINVSSKHKPGVVNQYGQVLSDSEVQELAYAGALVRAQLKPFAYDKKGNAGVAFGLNNLQLLGGNLPRIDGRSNAAEVFSAVADVADMPISESAAPTAAPVTAKASAAKAPAVKDINDLL